MADENDENIEIEDENRTREGAEQAKALDKLTDLVPESEKQLDENKAKQAIGSLAEAQKAEKEAQRLREKELAAVKINKEDIDVIATEFETDKKLAERRLRECGGDLEKALQSYL